MTPHPEGDTTYKVHKITHQEKQAARHLMPFIDTAMSAARAIDAPTVRYYGDRQIVCLPDGRIYVDEEEALGRYVKDHIEQAAYLAIIKEDTE
jgi:hypothetical protein